MARKIVCEIVINDIISLGPACARYWRGAVLQVEIGTQQSLKAITRRRRGIARALSNGMSERTIDLDEGR